MTVPSPTHTRTPTSVTLTLAAPIASVVLDDTGTYTPAATGRQWKVDTVNVTGATADPQTVKVFGAGDGTLSVQVAVTNTDGTASSTGSDITVTDNISSDITTALGTRLSLFPSQMPPEYSDPTIATPGMPTGKNVYAARTLGTVLPSALTPNVGV